MYLRVSIEQPHLFPWKPMGYTGVIALWSREPSSIQCVYSEAECEKDHIIIITIIIIIAFKGAIRDFLQSPHSAANCLQHARASGPGAIVCKSRATHRALITCKCHVTCHLVRKDSSAIHFDGVEIAFILALFYWLIH